MEDGEKKIRSPQFPFIPLEKSIARARQFEGVFGQNAGRPANVAKTWDYTEKSSGGIQTIAALSAFGLLQDEGSGETRKLRLTPLAMTILKDKRPGAADGAIKTAALKPKVIAELWNEWGGSRPPDHECLSVLHLDKKFAEDAAQRLLKIYDATIQFAKLVESDKKPDNDAESNDADGEPDGADDTPGYPPRKPGKVSLMENERVVFAHELRPNQGFRIVVTGEVDKSMVDALKAFAEFQAKLVPATGPAKTAESDAKE